MFNVLIVDDQRNIREGLQAMLSQFPLPLGELFCAANGVEALRLLQESLIHLVITDIRMPDMDGLELMAGAKAAHIHVDFLIISGYGEFAYAQKAIELGAKGYMLKPVKREELQTAVDHVLQEIRTKQELSRDWNHMSMQVKETERKELCMFMQGAAYDDAWVVQNEQHNPELWRNYRLCLLREERWINQPGASNAHSIEAIAYSVYGTQGCLCLQQGTQLILAVDASIDADALPAALKSAQIDAITVMTHPHKSLRALPDSYAQLMDVNRHSYLFPEKRCMLPAYMEGLAQQWQIPHDELQELFQHIGNPSSCKIAEGISSLFHKNVLRRYNVRYTQQLCRATVELIEEYERVIRPYLGEEALDIDCLRNLFDYPGIREYIQALQQQLLRLNQLYYDFKCSYRNTRDLNEAIRFIHENYHKPLDLAMVSNHVSLNYAYFSNLFKKNIGKGFTEYLRDVRLDKARRLLAETEHKIIDVTDMVGYESYKSFTRAFRDVMGMQPNEYRQQMRRKVE
ncbi:two-component system response regulator YesN [Paenibacillus cellulosilyticus]|uniref:Two-component system response regulator YesN n=1 Tax=Paenibacillus cellulosilyticus TaxID=375489 RepID=A0A2V2YXN1_9BACL|nr:response regulator [Paenibacillus cellulosilyticus]PWW05060.1 two-component system response regulator YesN [Paenibacillus cellulosilyticus]QKS48616.1 response regulator [Paenibacillus cellulosilyticus]